MTYFKKGYFISLGGGENQLGLILAARRLGLSVITIDRNPSAIGFQFSDIKIQESILEDKKIIDELEKLLLPSEIIGIGCRTFGKANLVASIISDRLNLKFTKSSTLEIFYDKEKIQDFLEKSGILIPKIILNKERLKPDKKVILKPKIGESKKGILIKTIKDLKKLSNDDTLIIQEYIQGKEVTVLGLINHKRVYIYSMTDKITTIESPFLEVAHLYPSENIKFMGEIHFILQKIVLSTELTFSAFCAEFKITEKGIIYLIEFVPEIGGEFLADKLIPELGFPFFEDYILTLCGEKLNKKSKFNFKESILIYFACPPKGISKYIGREKLQIKETEKILLERDLKNIGEIVDTKDGNLSRVYVLVIKIKQVSELKKNLADIQNRVGVKFESIESRDLG